MIHPTRVRMPFNLPSLSMVWTWCGGLPSWVAASSTPGHSPITACSPFRSTEMFTLLDMFLLSCVLRGGTLYRPPSPKKSGHQSARQLPPTQSPSSHSPRSPRAQEPLRRVENRFPSENVGSSPTVPKEAVDHTEVRKHQCFAKDCVH